MLKRMGISEQVKLSKWTKWTKWVIAIPQLITIFVAQI